MAPGLAADVVVLAHLAFILFGMFGALLALKWRWIPWLHVPAVAWAAWVELSGRICPLTPLERWFRRAAGEAGYEGDFIDRYVTAFIYPEGLTRELQIVLGVLLVTLNGAIYAMVWRRRTAPGNRAGRE
jgi:hypothetical protein